MRKFAWLTLVAAAALFFGVQGSAFAHANHDHYAHSQSVVAANIETVTVSAVGNCGSHAEEYVSSADLQKQQCRYGHTQSDCDSCCVCSASASVAIDTSQVFPGVTLVRSEAIPLAAPYIVRQAILDLSRPPKSFA